MSSGALILLLAWLLGPVPCASASVNPGDSMKPRSPGSLALVLVASEPVALYLLQEMQTLPGEGDLEAGPNSTGDRDFQKAWVRLNSGPGQLLAKLDKTHFVGMSRWAKNEMASFSLSPGWWQGIPMTFQGTASDSGQQLFGGNAETSKAILPAHSPIVFRRIVLFAWFDPVRREITRVIATIRGWREE